MRVDESSAYYQEQVRQAKQIMTPFTLRRLKSQVLIQLPAKVSSTEHCQLTETQWTLYRGVVERSLRVNLFIIVFAPHTEHPLSTTGDELNKRMDVMGCDGAEAGGWWDSGRGHPPVCTEQAATGARPHKPPLTTNLKVQRY
ncbi:uncharacterized protein LOC135350577 isoform X3 [Halichondria panicea]|uniref:uncharacterized protein LOC135350577 isoform X3 n=1 Tax=Halichondria panicea TaxID=6063 RepID=UPI00312B9DC9